MSPPPPTADLFPSPLRGGAENFSAPVQPSKKLRRGGVRGKDGTRRGRHSRHCDVWEKEIRRESEGEMFFLFLHFRKMRVLLPLSQGNFVLSFSQAGKGEGI